MGVSVCMYQCVYVCVCVSLCVYLCVCIYMRVYLCMYICEGMSVCVFLCSPPHTLCVHVCAHTKSLEEELWFPLAIGHRSQVGCWPQCPEQQNTHTSSDLTPPSPLFDFVGLVYNLERR